MKLDGSPASPSTARRNRRRQKKTTSPNPASTPPAVQRLFDVCREVFAGGGPGVVPPPDDVARILSVLDTMKLTDLNLTKNMPYFGCVRMANRGIPVTYLPVYEGEKFSIAIFCLPQSAVIPLHNHPGMTVFSKILFGKMQIKSYDLVEDPVDATGGMRLGKINTDAIVTAPCSTSILYPTSGGNIHRFTALTACAVLDVLGPPYCDSEGRHCTYYNDIPCSKRSAGEGSGDGNGDLGHDGAYAWLEERKKPEDFVVLGGNYTGPEIDLADAS